jgi:hypothetical protein
MKKPNTVEFSWLKRISYSAMMVTNRNGTKEYSLQDGTPIPENVAATLIKHGWVVGQKDGLFDESQTYRALTPNR